MACTCTETKIDLGNGVIIGSDKVICQECIDKAAQEAKNSEIREKEAYLASTDYIVIRQLEQNTLSTEDFDAIKTLRQAARNRINELQA